RTAPAIQADLDDAYAARTRILRGGQAKGADGANKSEVSYKDLCDSIRSLETELSFARCGGGISCTPTIGTGS
ncbi:MAG TPA: hypothetical protein VHX44_03470, partial [Planctomycetota bacterium]|nr:hypothetical protein [Planctomycetota bacterium]